MKQSTPTNLKKSKNISQIPKSIILTGKILQSISLHLATLYAVKLFRTPIKHKPPKREEMMAKSAQKEMILIPEIGKKIMLYSYGYSKRKVLLIHGWSGRGTQLYKIADKLLENGLMTISFDAPAHGNSESKTTMMTEFIASAKFLEQKYGPFEIIIGHSLGGMATLNSIKQGVFTKKAVIIGAGDIITDIIAAFINKLDLNPKIIHKMKNYFFKKFGENIDNYSTSEAAKKVNIPTLIIHDTNDKEVPVSCAINIRKYAKKGELLITNSLGHTRILKDDYVISKILDFILKEK
ncbi:alpha/beta hydrolase [uncultured Lutibacter sp.]|uniref:alpha/beta hydrolase family protein n=1 Tax=Lutibacter sp. TaxID=1925666 RepID=UPI00260D4FBA|nr:alpha/beta hydrolase [uncultured Lutibacter sp.]